MKINNNDNTPIYEQIYKQFLEYISAGLMQSEDKLPSVRELSSSMHINPNTVVKAYRLLEEQGFIYSIPGKGSFVSSKQSIQTKIFTEQINELIQELVIKSKYVDMDADHLCDLIRKKWEDS